MNCYFTVCQRIIGCSVDTISTLQTQKIPNIFVLRITKHEHDYAICLDALSNYEIEQS